MTIPAPSLEPYPATLAENARLQHALRRLLRARRMTGDREMDAAWCEAEAVIAGVGGP